MKKSLKIAAIIILILISALFGFLYFASEPLPVGQQGIKAEELTDKIQAAIKKLGTRPLPFLLPLEGNIIIFGIKNAVSYKLNGKTKKCYTTRKSLKGRPTRTTQNSAIRKKQMP